MGTLMTYSEVAAQCGVSEKTLSRWVNAGQGPTPMRINRNTVRFNPSVVADWRASIRPTI